MGLQQVDNLWIGIDRSHLTHYAGSNPPPFSISPERRVFPPPAIETTVAVAYGATRERHPDDRPWIGLCMVTSIDGSTVVDGDSQALSGSADREVMAGLRRLADVVVVGASTVRKEGYGPPSKPGLTVGVVTRSGNLNLETDLFSSGAGFLILPEDTPIANPSVRCVRAGHGTVDLLAAMQQLSGTFAQLEGGPLLNAAMFAADLVDEINITISPLVVGGLGPRVTQSAPDLHGRFELAHVIHADDFLFIRYLRRSD
ncbi:MAG: dihydrofolate reductase family protein [Actinomycetota bacterium]